MVGQDVGACLTLSSFFTLFYLLGRAHSRKVRAEHAAEREAAAAKGTDDGADDEQNDEQERGEGDERTPKRGSLLQHTRSHREWMSLQHTTSVSINLSWRSLGSAAEACPCHRPEAKADLLCRAQCHSSSYRPC